MPTYEYSCAACAHKLEAFQKISDPPLTVCPSCQKGSLVRGIGGGSAHFQFKGKGFYETDYKVKKEGGGGSSCCPCHGGGGKGGCSS